MMKGQVCKFYELNNTENDQAQEDCLGTSDPPVAPGGYDKDPAYYQNAAGFRYGAFIAYVSLPVICLCIEMFLNQIILRWRHMIFQFIFCIGYALITLLWQAGTGIAVIFPNKLDWICSKRAYNDDDPDCIFD